MNKQKGASTFKLLLASGLAAAIVVGTIYVVTEQPLMFRFIEEKLNGIITPTPPIGIAPAVRDIRGTWKSALSGKGMQIYGKIVAGPSITTLYEDGDMEIVIDAVNGNVASGTIRYTNMCVTSLTTAPKIQPINLKQCFADTGYRPLTIRIDGPALDFGTVIVQGATVTMRGTYLTNIMTGSMTVTMPGYGEMKGEFHLMRK